MNSTYGTTREKLLANGYCPVSFSRPDLQGYRVADDCAAIACVPRVIHSLASYAARCVAVLTITTHDQALRKKILAVLDAHGLAKGPVRWDAGGNQTHLLRSDEYSPPMRQTSETLDGESDPAVAFDSWMRGAFGAEGTSSLVRVDGAWKNGDPLTVPRNKLPSIDDDALAALLNDLRSVFPREPARDYRYAPGEERPVNLREIHQPRMVPPRCKMDLRANPTMIEAMKADGTWDQLPDTAPDEAAA